MFLLLYPCNFLDLEPRTSQDPSNRGLPEHLQVRGPFCCCSCIFWSKPGIVKSCTRYLLMVKFSLAPHLHPDHSSPECLALAYSLLQRRECRTQCRTLSGAEGFLR